MAVVYVTSPKATVRVRAGVLQIVEDDETKADLRAHEIERLVVFGNVQVTTQAVAFLLQHGADVSFLSPSGRMRGALVSAASRNVFLRLAQFDRWRDEPFRIELARRLLRAKLTAQHRLLLRQRRNHPGRFEEVRLDELARLPERLADVTSIEEAMGFEGIGSALYFGQLRVAFTTIAFPGRHRHPAPDPVNALLSLTVNPLQPA